MYVQGIVGNIPGQAMAFLTLYLQLLGIDNFRASLLVSVGMLAHAVGGQLGGLIGDVAAKGAPRWGRIFVCQVSVVAGERAPQAPPFCVLGTGEHLLPTVTVRASFSWLATDTFRGIFMPSSVCRHGADAGAAERASNAACCRRIRLVHGSQHCHWLAQFLACASLHQPSLLRSAEHVLLLPMGCLWSLCISICTGMGNGEWSHVCVMVDMVTLHLILWVLTALCVSFPRKILTFSC